MSRFDKIGLAVLVALLALAGILRGLHKEQPRVALPPPPAHDSLVSARTRDSLAFEAWADSVLRLRGDSLARVFASRASTIRRARSRPDSTIRDTTILRDTVCLAGEDARTILVHDSSVIVSLDSARGALAECSFDREQLLDSVQHEPSGSGFALRTFGAGALAGAAVVLAVILGVR